MSCSVNLEDGTRGQKKEKIMRELIQDVLAHSRDRSSSIIDESEWQ